jgi:hypothetical protein
MGCVDLGIVVLFPSHLLSKTFGQVLVPIQPPIYRVVAATECPTRYRTQHFFNNFTTNEDITTKFEPDLPHCVRNVKEKNILLFKFHCNIFIGVRIIKEMLGLVASGTPCTLLCAKWIRAWNWPHTYIKCVRFWMHGAVSPLPHMPSWYAKGSFTFVLPTQKKI